MIEPHRRTERLLLVRTVSQHEIDHSQAGGKHHFFRVLRLQQQRHHIHADRLAIWLGMRLLPHGKNHHILQHRQCLRLWGSAE